MPMPTYGVTTTDVEAMANGMALTSSTRPTAAQVEMWIEQHAARASAAVRGAGADPATVEADTASEGYALCAQYVTLAASAQTVVARDRADSDLARTYRDQATTILGEIRTLASALGDSRDTSVDAPGQVYAPVMSAVSDAPTADAAFWSNPRGQI